MRKWSVLIIAVSAAAAVLVGASPPERGGAAPDGLDWPIEVAGFGR